MKVAILARVSSEQQVDGFSLPAQLRVMHARIEREGWELVRTFEAPGESASTRYLSKRPVLKELVAAAARREFEAVLFHESSRLARDEELSQWLINELEAYGVRLVEADKPLDYFYSPDGRVHYGIQGVLNAWQSRKHGAQVAKGKRERFEQGLHVGDLPFGYRMQLEEQPDGTVVVATKRPAVVVPEEAAAIRQAFIDRVGGVGATEIAERWNAQGLRPHSKQGNGVFTPSAVESVFDNEFYAGFVVHKGERRRGAHERIIDEDLYLAVQSRRRRGVRATRARSVRALSGVAVCSECLGPLWLSWSGPSGRKQQYYRETSRIRQRTCTNRGLGWWADEVDEVVGSVIRGMAVDSEWVASVDRDARRMPKGDAFAREREQLEAQRRRAARAFVSGMLGEQELEEMRTAIDARLAQLPAALPGGVLFALERLVSVGQVWDGMTHEERRQGVRLLLEEVQVDVRSKRLWLKPWEEVEDVMRLRREFVLAMRPRQDSNLRPSA